ncbi:hypothetical protein OCOJLMKI_5324 [Methylobacterium iners]|uniref:IstB-like ATP-binding domain-containing protein n=1 Tax=Methylobacterium iners TaxID=418707 RepID=A0ABQ4S8U0_9HYPH|nr:hypothetical protein OCOJLMKI_5324 [Methylobacterium iners]
MRCVRDLHQGNFLTDNRNAVLIGGTGSGKTHLAIAIGANCVREREARVRFFNTVDLVNQPVLGRHVAPAATHLEYVQMPEITRRSSTRGLPGSPRGRCGSITAQASSDNQNRRAIATSRVSEPNHRSKTQISAVRCMRPLPEPRTLHVSQRVAVAGGASVALWVIKFSVGR